MNKITLIGNLTRDPETTTLSNGTDATRLGLAVQRKFKKKMRLFYTTWQKFKMIVVRNLKFLQIELLK